MKKQRGAAANRQRVLDVRLQLLRNDHTTPSLTIAHQAIDLAKDWVEAGLHPKRLALEFHSMHPGRALIANLAQMLDDAEERTVASLRLLQESLREGNRQIAERLAGLVPRDPVVISLSNSATVRDALAHIGARAVYLVDSRPGSESVQMADQLRRCLSLQGRDAPIHLIEANAIGNIVPRVDCAVVGSDSVSRSGAVLHKVGTLPLALCCRHFGKSFYALGHSLKQIDHELIELPPANGVLETQVFDITPAELITCMVTERTSIAKALMSRA